MIKKMLITIAASLVALAFNLEWESHPSPNTTIKWGGPPWGLALCGVICMVLIYRTFLTFQDFLIKKHYLERRIQTSVDLVPLIILLPFAVGYSVRSEAGFFAWGENEWRPLYFVAILITIALFQFFRVVQHVSKVPDKGK